MGIRIRKMDDAIGQKLGKFLTCGRFDYIDGSVLNKSMAKSLIYPTDDFHLCEDQFCVVKSLLSSGEDLYLLQMGIGDGFFAEDNEIYICSDLDYAEYNSIWLDTISVLAPASWQWLILVDEALEGGLGVFVSTKELVEKFNSIYKRTASDMVSFVELFVKGRAKNLDYMMEVLQLFKE